MSERCGYCETGTAIGTRREVETSWSDENGGREITTTHKQPVCAACNEWWWDTMEGFEPLPALV